MSAIRTNTTERMMAEAAKDGQRDVTQLKRKYAVDTDEIKAKTEHDKARISKDYELQINNEKNKYELELVSIRKKYETLKGVETERLSRELEDMQLSHNEKVVELRKNQEKEIEKYQETQRNFVDNFKDKMAAERLKHDV